MNKLSLIKDHKPWYKDGLRFRCTECGKCCTGKPGFVWVTEDEVHKIADFLKITYKQVMQRYIRREEGRLALVELRLQNNDCIFLKGKKCQIYPVRPKQCRTFPWWVYNLKSKEAWDNAAANCEGINDEAPIVTFEEIQKVLFSNH